MSILNVCQSPLKLSLVTCKTNQQYVGYPSDTESSLLSSLIAHYQHQQNGQLKIHSLLYSELDVPLPLHISLSRPIVLKTEERAAFTRIFEDQIVESAIGP